MHGQNMLIFGIIFSMRLSKLIKVNHIASKKMRADILTKVTSKLKHEKCIGLLEMKTMSKKKGNAFEVKCSIGHFAGLKQCHRFVIYREFTSGGSDPVTLTTFVYCFLLSLSVYSCFVCVFLFCIL